MASPMTQTPENRNAKRTSVSISGPAYMVAVGGSPRGSKAKTRKSTTTISKETFGEECRITSRYLGPSTGSCHDLCKQEALELKAPATSFVSRKTSVVKNKGVKRIVVSNELVEAIKSQNSKRSLSTNKKSTQNELKPTKNHAKERSVSSSANNGSEQLIVRKSTSVERVKPKINHTGSLPRNRKLVTPLKDQSQMTKNKNKQLIAKNVTEMTEMTMHEAKTADLEFVPLTVEIIESTPPTVTTESTDLPSSLSSQNEEVILSEVGYEMVTSEGNSKCRVVICEDEENGELEVKFRTGTVVEVESEDDGSKKLKFMRGTVVADDCEDESETVTLKHQETQEQKAQELLNRVIEETASKLVVNRKTKVGALVGAFESIISLENKLLLPTY